MLNYAFHSKELKFRIFYCSLSWVFTFGCVYFVFDDTLFSLSPSIPTFYLYGNAFEVILTKISLSFSISFWLVLPHVIYMLWLFIRPGFYQHEIFYGPSLKKLAVAIILPWLLYYLTLDFVTFTLQNLSSYYYRFLPTLTTTSHFITSLLTFSNFMALFPTVFLYLLKILEGVYKKLRLIVMYVVIAIATWVLPPDVVYLAIAGGTTVVILEGLYFSHLIIKEYKLKLSSFFLLYLSL